MLEISIKAKIQLQKILLCATIIGLILVSGCGCNKTVNRTKYALDQQNIHIQPQENIINQQYISQSTLTSNVNRTSNQSNEEKSIYLGEFKTKISPEAERKLIQSIKFMQNGDYSNALPLLEEIVKNYPNSEEASVAEYCIAEIYFRNKANDRALQKYKEIVQKYPNTLAAENAKEAIVYLETFSEIEKDYISPDVDDKKRRTSF